MILLGVLVLQLASDVTPSAIKSLIKVMSTFS